MYVDWMDIDSRYMVLSLLKNDQNSTGLKSLVCQVHSQLINLTAWATECSQHSDYLRYSKRFAYRFYDPHTMAQWSAKCLRFSARQFLIFVYSLPHILTVSTMPNCAHQLESAVAKLVRRFTLDPKGRGFDSCSDRPVCVLGQNA